MKKIIIVVTLLIPVVATGAMNTYVHRSICKGNRQCMTEQARAYSLWVNQNWDSDLKKVCRNRFIKSYHKDYIGAVNCVYPLQLARQDYMLQQSEIEKNRAETEYYRKGGRRYKD